MNDIQHVPAQAKRGMQ